MEFDMDERENTQYWEENAPEWVRLVRGGFDESRYLVNSPAFLAMLPDVNGLHGLDLGCGEATNTRLVAERGARMTALDAASTMMAAAGEEERRDPRNIRLVQGAGAALPFCDGAFDFAVAFMSLMDMPDHERVIREIRRVLAPGGFFQLSMTHPCFQTPMWEWIKEADGRRRALICGDYYRELNGEIEEWTFTAALRAGERPRPFRIPRFTHTLSTWLNMFVDAGFMLERFVEPTVDEATLAAHPRLYDHRIIAYFLIIRVRNVGK